MSFIILEGTEGCGKSTQIHSLTARLFEYSKFFNVLLTREPYNSEEIRRRLIEEENPYSNAELMTDLYVQDRKNHLDELIIPSLNMGVHVISDRYKHSTIAYQSCQGMSLDSLIKKHEGLLVPDITFVIDVPVKVSVKRLKKRKDKRKEKKFETSKEFLEQLRARYLEMPSILKDENVLVVDGNKKPEKVSRVIWDYVVKHVL